MRHSFFSMAGLPFLFKAEDAVRTEINAEPAVNTDHRFVGFIVPEYGMDHTGIAAVSAADTLFRFKRYPSALSQFQCPRGTNPGTGRIFACPADNDLKAPLHATDGADADAGFGQTSFILPSRACEHAQLAPNTFFCFQYGESHIPSPFSFGISSIDG